MVCCQDGRERNSAWEDPAPTARRIRGTIVVLYSPRIAIRVTKKGVAVIRRMVGGKFWYTGPIIVAFIVLSLTHLLYFVINYGEGSK